MAQREVYRGIRNEDGRFDSRFARRAAVFVQTLERKLGTDITYMGDPLPVEGSAIIISNHPGTLSTLHLPWVAGENARVIDVIVKDTLLNVKKGESSKVLAATGKTGNEIFSSNSESANGGGGIKKRLKKALVFPVRWMAAPYIRDGVNAIPIDRDGASVDKLIETQERADATLKQGRLLGLFLQWTRTPEDSLDNIKDLAATIIRRNKKVPVYVLVQVHGEDGRLHMILDKFFTYESLVSERGKKLNKEEVTAHLATRASRLLLQHRPLVTR